MVVQKFGGSSVADGLKMAQVANIVLEQQEKEPVVVVLSAMKGTTNALLEGAERAQKGDLSYKDLLDGVMAQHHEAAKTLIQDPGRFIQLEKVLKEKIEELKDILHGVELVKECSLRSHDLISGYGEKLSTLIFSEYLKHLGHEAKAFDTSDGIIISDDNHGRAQVHFQESYSNIKKMIGNYKGLAVVTGFIALSHTGQPTTLGRNGSDYTASLVGAGLGADRVEIWTDVDGVLSGDPRIIEGTFVIPELSLEEAMELSYFGAEVIHPSTMIPVVENHIPLWIKNTLNPKAPGTLIGRNITPHDREITGVASIGEAALLNIEGGGMIGIPGFASRVFSALAKGKVNIIMISQASSEHSICVVIRERELDRAVRELKLELEEELSSKRVQDIQIRKNLEIIAVIGENMRGRPGLSGRLFSALGEKGINILVIAQHFIFTEIESARRNYMCMQVGDRCPPHGNGIDQVKFHIHNLVR